MIKTGENNSREGIHTRRTAAEESPPALFAAAGTLPEPPLTADIFDR
jgi:hypothetical protein